MLNTTTEEFFEAKYKSSEDPWNFATDEYEQARYDAIVAALERRRFRHAWEPACSVGVLTERLAELCDRVDAFDISTTAAAAAQIRCAAKPNAHIWHGSLRDNLPIGCDLLMFCEVGYYFTCEELIRVMLPIVRALSPSATVIACHWLGMSQDHLLSGDEVHEVLHSLPGLEHEHAERYQRFRLDRWRKTAAGKEVTA